MAWDTALAREIRAGRRQTGPPGWYEAVCAQVSPLLGLTVDEVRRSKLANLATIGRELAEGSETVTVRRGEERRWLTGLTDVRLVLGARLGIEDDADSRRVHDLAVTATQDSSAAQSRADEVRMAMASLYSGLAWWQESLLAAVTRDQRGN